MEGDRKEDCNGCHKCKIINKECETHLCKNCCCNSPKSCRPHNKGKKVALHAEPPSLRGNFDDHQPIRKKIDAAIFQNRSVYISYPTEKGYEQIRQIRPISIEGGRNGDKVLSHCYLRNDTRHFFLHKILRIEDYNWATLVGNGSTAPQAQGILTLSIVLFSYI